MRYFRTWASIQPHPHVEEALDDLLPGRAVELGGGEGRQAIWLASRGWEMTADEFASVLAKTAAALSPGGTLFILGWDRQNFTDGIGGPRPSEVLYSIDDMVGALKEPRIARAEQVLQAGSSGAVDTLLMARRPAT